MNLDENRLLKRKRKAFADGNKPALCSACINLANFYYNERLFKQSIKEFKEAADAYYEEKKYLEYGTTHRMIGEAYTSLLCYDSALKHQQIHLEYAKKEGNKKELQRALATIGHTYLLSAYDSDGEAKSRNLTLAKHSFNKSLIVCESVDGISARDQFDMVARLFANLSLVEECLGNVEESVRLVEKSVGLCKKYDLYEQLERGYTILGSIYTKRKEFNKAVLHYNLAIETSTRLPDRKTLMCAALVAKADIFVQLADFSSAKNVLLKAYKMKHPVKGERDTIEETLKVVAALYYTEEALITTDDNDCETKKNLYEKMGDGACYLKLFSKAIEYYLNMLKEAKLCGDEGNKLLPVYVSLAQTYKDNKEYDQAVEYFYQEYSLYSVKDKDSQSTLFNIADCMESSGKNVYEIEKVYNKALADAEKSNDVTMRGQAFVRLCAFYRKNEMMSRAEKIEAELKTIDYEQSSESESENTDIEVTTNIGDDICIDDITDNSDASDNDEKTKPRAATRKRVKDFAKKKNDKGETALHTACISGNVALVRKLLQQGHPINVRDNAGWIPLHEACNLGHKDLVELLLDHGASMNDRGGTSCNGITPLHDAASNGHFEVVELLLNRGASVIAKTDDGETSLDMLTQWRERVDGLDATERIFYDTLVDRMTKALEKSGQSSSAKSGRRRSGGPCGVTATSSASRPQRYSFPSTSSTKIVERIERHNSFSRTTSNSSVPSVRGSDCLDSSDSDGESGATNAYKEAMFGLRNKGSETVQQRTTKEPKLKQSALLQPEEVDNDHWLEDDIGAYRPEKRRKTTSDEYLNPAQRRNKVSDLSTTSPNKRSIDERRGSSVLSRKQQQDVDEVIDIPDDFFDVDFIDDVRNDRSIVHIRSDINVSDFNPDADVYGNQCKRKRKQQSSLIAAGFTRSHTDKSPTKYGDSKMNGNQCKSVRKQQKQLTNFGMVRTTSNPNISSTICGNEPDVSILPDVLNFTSSSAFALLQPVQTFSVNIRIEEAVLRIPVPQPSDVNVLTVKWLKDETVKRYAKKEFRKPILDIETQSGVGLVDENSLGVLFPPGAASSELLIATIVKWILPSLCDRYKEACVVSCVDENVKIMTEIKLGGIHIDLSNVSFKRKKITPLLKALKHQLNLKVLNLFSTAVGNEGLQLLCSSFSTLIGLSCLNLGLNNLNERSLQTFANVLIEAESAILPNLTDLNLSFNPLGNGAYKHLVVITTYLKLNALVLKACDFTNDIFNDSDSSTGDLDLKRLDIFDISNNCLGVDGVVKFISFLNPRKIVELSMGNNYNVKQSGLVTCLTSIFNVEALNLQVLNVERCEATDEEVDEFLRILENAANLRIVNLSYNKQLTASTLKRLFEHTPSMSEIYIEAVDLFDGFDTSTLTNWKIEQNAANGLKSVKLTVNHEINKDEVDFLSNLWLQCNPGKGAVRRGKLGVDLHLTE